MQNHHLQIPINPSCVPAIEMARRRVGARSVAELVRGILTIPLPSSTPADSQTALTERLVALYEANNSQAGVGDGMV